MNIILYHGTTYNRYISVKATGKLKVTSDDLSHFPSEGHAKTRLGYVYLTDDPLVALEFGSRCWSNDYLNFGCRLLTVVAVSIPEENLEIDTDEEYWQAALLKGAKYYRIHRDIELSSEGLKMGFFQFDSFQSCDNYMLKKNYEHIRWSKLDGNKLWNGDNGPMTDS